MDIIKPLLKLALLGSQWVMILLLGLSVFSLAAMVERWFFYRARERDLNGFSDALAGLVEAGDVEATNAYLAARGTLEASIFARAVRWAKGGPEALADAVDSEMMKRKPDFERGMNLLGTLGSNAPFIGLLGTVIGVIEAFNQLGAGQDKSAMASVMAGIAEALVATGVGLFVAIPAVVAFNVFQKRLATVEDNVAAVTKQLSALLKSGGVVKVKVMAPTTPVETRTEIPEAAASTPELAG